MVSVRAIKHSFKKDETPLHFRSYLTLAYNPRFDPVTVFDHEFWVGQVLETTIHPGEYNRFENEYHKSEVYGAGAAIGFGVVVLLILGFVPTF